MRRSLLIIMALGFLIGIPGLFLVQRQFATPTNELLKQARTALKDRDFVDAERLVKPISSTYPYFTDAMLIAG